ncbi:MAG: type II toxin-antitoxin system RelE/ParE family toxin [Candidatus Limnocylindria bacterium]
MARRRWRDYQTPGGARPVRAFLRSLPDEDYADVRAAMGDVAEHGLPAARHLRDDIYEVRSSGDRVAYRVLFAAEGARGQVLLALEAFKKKTQKTPPATIALAERRLHRWRARGRE